MSRFGLFRLRSIIDVMTGCADLLNGVGALCLAVCHAVYLLAWVLTQPLLWLMRLCLWLSRRIMQGTLL